MMKPGYQTSEFWIAIITKLLAVFCVAGVITTADEQKLAATATNAVIGVFAIITAGKVIGEYIKGRSTVKSSFLPLALLAIMLMPGIASAQPLTTHHAPLTRYTCLFGCRCGRGGGQADPQMMALLQQIASQQQQILALLQQQHAPPSQPQQPMLIVLGGPQQQIPLGGPPRQDIPLGGPPRQEIPLGGPPRQEMPLGPAPKQEVPLGPAPKQQIPLGPEQPMPKAGATGYQRYSKAVTYSWRPASRRE
jgi:hypothetical protein